MEFLKKAWIELKDTANEWFDADDVCVRPYYSYATTEKVVVRGRVLENEGVVKIEENTTWDNFIQTVRMLESDEIKNTTVLIEFEDKVFTTQTDNDGYFYAEIFQEIIPTNKENLEWKTATVSATEHKDETGKMSTAKASILLPHYGTEHVVVSDIDDTVIETGVNSFLKLAVVFNTLLKNHQTRTPFEGIGEVLHRLSLNDKGQKVNPLFYLSNSPWNLYTLLTDLFRFRDIPMGPLFLRDYGIKFGSAKEEFSKHKKLHLEKLMIDFPEKQFILIGDATEKDAPIYLEVFNEFPGRVKKIFIRASFKERRNSDIRSLIEQNPDAPIHLISHSYDILELCGIDC